MGESEPLLSVRELRVAFPSDRGTVQAADGVSFDVAEGEVVAVVGESGSGKTVTALSVLRLLPRTARISGQVLFRGTNVLDLPDKKLEALRGDKVAMVFQDALAALNPLHRVGDQVGEAIRLHNHKISAKDERARVVELLTSVGIPNPAARSREYPHQFSGGMRQRAMIAMAIANDPDLLIADEPTTALDVTTQAQVLEVLAEARARTGSAMVIISHDLGVVAGVADRVVVMYAGRVVETGTVRQVFHHPEHPYTAGLLATLPRLDDRARRRLARIPGQPPSPVDLPPGCPFHPRCTLASLPEPCADERPELRSVTEADHRSACHFAGALAARPLEAGR
ncbi:MAG TPA: ABC transporter ATP-binding protein [Acidimicrobiales bacterium]|nr:ABC transporter ATP-binding protein [Acidimicrobiales bacterium]